ncbi:MAG: hypothetical protein QME79_12325 [Bacillota bacterium]|nr:hypothetical protein [Bacillota bacterium]
MADEATIEVILRAKNNASPAIKELEQSAQKVKRSLEDLGQTGDALQNQLWAIKQRSELLGKEYDANAEKAKAYRQAIEQLTLEGHKAEEEAMRELVAAYRQAEEASKSLTDRLKEHASAIRTIAATAAAAFAGVALAVRSVAGASMEAEAAFKGVESVARNLGISTEAVRKAASDLAADGLAPVTTYATALRDLLTAGLGLPEAVRLIEVFKDRAAFGRKETVAFDEAITNLTQSFKTERSQLADNSGMVENYSQLLERGAQILGKKVSELNNAERAQAKYLAILEASAPYEGNSIKLSQTLAGAQGRLAKATFDLKVAIGDALKPALISANDLLAQMLTHIRNWLQESPELVQAVTALTGGLAGALALLSSIALLIPRIRDGMIALHLSFGPFLVGGIILGGLAAIVAKFVEARREAALLKKDLDAITDIQEARQRVDAAAKALRTAEDFAKRARQGGYGERLLGPWQLDPEVVRARTELERAKAHLAELTRTQQEYNTQAAQGAEATRTAADVLKDMQHELAVAETLEQLLGDAFDLNAEKAKIFRKALEGLADLGVKPTDKEMRNLVSQLQQVTQEIQKLEASKILGLDLENYEKRMGWLRRNVIEQVNLIRQGLTDEELEAIANLQDVYYQNYEKRAAWRRRNLVEQIRLIREGADAEAQTEQEATVTAIREGEKRAAWLRKNTVEQVELIRQQAEAARQATVDTITAVLEGSRSLGEVVEGIFRGKAHNSIRRFVEDALDSFRELKAQGMTIFQAIAQAIKANFGQLNMWGGMGIGATAGGELGSPTGAAWGALAGGVIGTIIKASLGPIGAIIGGLLGGIFGPKPAPPQETPQQQALEELAGNLRDVWKTTERVRRVVGYWQKEEGSGSVPIYEWVEVPITPVLKPEVLAKIKEQIGTALDSIGNALGAAFEAADYEEFTARFGQNLEAMTKKALISAFMASDTVRPLLNQLSDVITQAVLDGTLTAQERQTIVDLYSRITEQSGTFYEALQQLGIATDNVAGSMTALGEALRNVPTGFKIATVRWEAALPKYHSGGYVPEDGPAFLRRGEVVLTPEQQRMSSLTIHNDFRGATIYGVDDLDRRIRMATAKAARQAGLAQHGLAVSPA